MKQQLIVSISLWVKRYAVITNGKVKWQKVQKLCATIHLPIGSAIGIEEKRDGTMHAWQWGMTMSDKVCIKEIIQKICINGKNNTNPYLTLHRVPLTPLATTGKETRMHYACTTQMSIPICFITLKNKKLRLR